MEPGRDFDEKKQCHWHCCRKQQVSGSKKQLCAEHERQEELTGFSLNPTICTALVDRLGSARTATEVERAVTAIREYYRKVARRGEQGNRDQGPGTSQKETAHVHHVPVSAL